MCVLVLAGTKRSLKQIDVHQRVGSADPMPITMYMTLALLHMQTHVMHLAGRTYSSLHALVGACLARS